MSLLQFLLEIIDALVHLINNITLWRCLDLRLAGNTRLAYWSWSPRNLRPSAIGWLSNKPCSSYTWLGHRCWRTCRGQARIELAHSGLIGRLMEGLGLPFILPQILQGEW